MVLLSWPTEIIQSILAYIPARDLSQNVEVTCKELRRLTIPVYRIRYGHEPAPSVPVTSSYWKRFAIRHENYQSDGDRTRNEVIDGFLESYFNCPDHFNLTNAEDVICYLHNNPHVHSRGIEAIVAALNIQHRCQDSDAFLLRYCNSDAMPFQTVALLQARFNLNFPVSWSTCPSEVLDKCLLAAVTSGNMELLVYLKQILLGTGQHVQVLQAARAAVRSDRVGILRQLHSIFDVEFHRLPLGTLMEEAVKFDCANAVQALLELGPRIDLKYPYNLALRYCNLDVLQRFKEHSPDISGTHLPNGELQIAFILSNGFSSWANKSKAIEFLFKHASVDINATGKDGLAAVHVAAVNNNINALELFENLGADMMSLGDIEQTPAEIAICNGYNILFIGCSSFPAELFITKKNMAKVIIGKYCDAIFRRQQACSDFDHALNDAESKLADIFAKNIGLKTMQEVLSIIGTPLFKSVEKFLGIITDFSKTRALIEPREEQLQDIKDILNKFLSTQYPDRYLTRLACYLKPKLVLQPGSPRNLCCSSVCYETFVMVH